MLERLLKSLVDAGTQWRQESPQWAETIQKWELWKSSAQQRAREAERLAKQKSKLRGEDRDAAADREPERSWESSFDPADPSPQFSFANYNVYSKVELEADIKKLWWTVVPSWAYPALRRGIAVHHAGMNKGYRSLVERYACTFQNCDI